MNRSSRARRRRQPRWRPRRLRPRPTSQHLLPNPPQPRDLMTMSADPEDHSMTLWEHLEELRSRIIRMALSFLVGAFAAWHFKEKLLDWLSLPYVQAWKHLNPGVPAVINFPSPAAAFLAYVRISAIAGLVFALPLILYQLWAFIAPGLYSREKRFAIPFVVSSCALFAGGAWFGWRFAFPLAFEYLLSFAGKIDNLTIAPTIMISEYIEFVSHMLLAFGFASELPILVFFLSIAGLVTHKTLISFFRYFIVVAFVISAILTPPDPLSQLMLAVPLCLLYALSIGVAFVFSRRKPASDEEPPQET
jgi:sec-independent protein translocase protein TatC